MWNVKISYALKEMGTSYSKVMGGLKKKGILLDRKILATLATENPETFKKVSGFSVARVARIFLSSFPSEF
jgi:large subunit ribosomal protein L20